MPSAAAFLAAVAPAPAGTGGPAPDGQAEAAADFAQALARLTASASSRPTASEDAAIAPNGLMTGARRINPLLVAETGARDVIPLSNEETPAPVDASGSESVPEGAENAVEEDIAEKADASIKTQDDEAKPSDDRDILVAAPPLPAARTTPPEPAPPPASITASSLPPASPGTPATAAPSQDDSVPTKASAPISLDPTLPQSAPFDKATSASVTNEAPAQTPNSSEAPQPVASPLETAPPQEDAAPPTPWAQRTAPDAPLPAEASSADASVQPTDVPAREPRRAEPGLDPSPNARAAESSSTTAPKTAATAADAKAPPPSALDQRLADLAQAPSDAVTIRVERSPPAAPPVVPDPKALPDQTPRVSAPAIVSALATASTVRSPADGDDLEMNPTSPGSDAAPDGETLHTTKTDGPTPSSATPRPEASRPETTTPPRPLREPSPASERQAVAEPEAGPAMSDQAPEPASAASSQPAAAPQSVAAEAASPSLVDPSSTPVELPAEPIRAQDAAPGRDLSPSQLSRATVETAAHLAANIIRRLEGRSTRFDMVLTPEDLGRVDVSLEIDSDGRLAARLAFDNPAAAADLRGRADELRRQLQDAGFQLSNDSLDFSQRDPSSGGGAFERQQQRHAVFAGGARLAAQADLIAAPPPGAWTNHSLTPDRVDVRV